MGEGRYQGRGLASYPPGRLYEMEGDMVVRKYEGYSGRMICGTLLER